MKEGVLGLQLCFKKKDPGTGVFLSILLHF